MAIQRPRHSCGRNQDALANVLAVSEACVYSSAENGRRKSWEDGNTIAVHVLREDDFFTAKERSNRRRILKQPD